MKKQVQRVNFTKLVNGGTRITRQSNLFPKPILQKQLKFKNTALLVVSDRDFFQGEIDVFFLKTRLESK